MIINQSLESFGMRMAIVSQLVMIGLSKWNWEEIGSLGKKIFGLQLKLKDRFGNALSPNSHRSLREEILLEQLMLQETMWKQKIHDDQILLGDRNTKNFHQKAERN